MHISMKKSSKRAELERENEKLKEQVTSLTKKIEVLKLQHKNALNALQEQHERETSVLLRAMHRGDPPPTLPLSALVEAEDSVQRDEKEKEESEVVAIASASIESLKTGCDSSETVSDNEDLSDSSLASSSFAAFCSSITPSPKEQQEEQDKEKEGEKGSNETEPGPDEDDSNSRVVVRISFYFNFF